MQGKYPTFLDQIMGEILLPDACRHEEGLIGRTGDPACGHAISLLPGPSGNDHHSTNHLVKNPVGQSNLASGAGIFLLVVCAHRLSFYALRIAFMIKFRKRPCQGYSAKAGNPSRVASRKD
jgi:hypothetical protein